MGQLMRKDTTEALVRRAQTGDRRAFEQLVEGYRDRLRERIASRLGAQLRKEVEVDDLLQETLLWAFKSIKRFEWRGEGSLDGWLLTIADHMVLNAANRRRRPKLQLTDDVPAEGASPSRRARREERFDRLEAALQRLSDDHRDVITLARIQGLSMKEIAERMQRSPDAVMQLLRRALQKLRSSFGDTTLSQIMVTEPRAPRQLNSRVPKDLETVALKCLRKDPKDRYGTAEALSQDLRRVVRGDPIEARRQPRWEVVARRLWRRRRRVLSTTAILVLASLLGQLAWKQHQDDLSRLTNEYESAVREAGRVLELRKPLSSVERGPGVRERGRSRRPRGRSPRASRTSAPRGDRSQAAAGRTAHLGSSGGAVPASTVRPGPGTRR